MGTRQRLVKTMAELMWDRGYADTSPRAVREHSGVGQGSLYHHFPTKRDLALAALEHTVSEALPASSVLESAGDPWERIQDYLLHQRDPLKGCRVGRMTQDPQVREDPVLLAPIADAFNQMKERWKRALEDAVSANELREDLDPETLAHTLMAVIQGGYVLAMAQQDPQPFRSAIQGALSLLQASTPTPADSRAPKKEEQFS